MSEQNVASRLKTFIESQGLTYSQFADSCGIPRPSLSQLLTGRNKKINDMMVGQIHSAYPDLSVVWLLFGEGDMLNSLAYRPADYSAGSATDGEIFDSDMFSLDDGVSNTSKKIIFSGNDAAASKNSKENGLNNASNVGLKSDYKDEKLAAKIKELTTKIEFLTKNPRKVKQITVYYDDFTFETFIPESK